MSGTLIKYYKSNDKQVSIVCGRGISKRFPMHRHRSVSVGMVINGMRLLNINSKRYIVDQGDIFIINADQPHAIGENTNPEHDYIVVSLSQKLIEKYLEPDNLQFENIVESKTLSAKLKNWFEVLIHSEKELHRSFDTENFIMSLADFQKAENQIETENINIQRIRHLLDRDLNVNHSLESLAEKAFLSPFHFSRLFRKQTGLAPHQYLLDNRLRQARELLEQNFSIIDIAIECGFYDASHFIRHFTKYYGVSPLTYQKGIGHLPV